jgi:hypothetical protein
MAYLRALRWKGCSFSGRIFPKSKAARKGGFAYFANRFETSVPIQPFRAASYHAQITAGLEKDAARAECLLTAECCS